MVAFSCIVCAIYEGKLRKVKGKLEKLVKSVENEGWDNTWTLPEESRPPLKFSDERAKHLPAYQERKMKRKYSLETHPENEADEDEICGMWIFRGRCLQKFAGYRVYVILFGLVTCLFQACHMYFTGTISTVEKRFGISSKVTGMITAGNDISALIVSTLLTYYASKQHQPRWIGFGMYTVVLFCLLCALPHFIFGPGEVALQLTKEYNVIGNDTTADDLCVKNGDKTCRTPNGKLWASLMFFAGQFASGIGGSLCSTIGISFLDDNVERSKVPVILSCIFFIQMLGRGLGLFISSICQKLYIVVSLSPIITNEDPRWLGAWWLGWIVLAFLVFVFSTLIAMFPKKLPEGTRKKQDTNNGSTSSPETPPSFSDLKSSLIRLFSNKTLMYNIVAVVFHFLGAAPFQLFLPKYIEIVFAQSSTSANRVIAKVGLLSGATGILLSGIFLSKYKPRGRTLAAWNVFVGIVVVLGVLITSRLECSPSLMNENKQNGNSSVSCAAATTDCNCDYVKFSPVCSIDGRAEFISPCHAGCSMTTLKNNKVYHHCRCVNDTKENMWEGTVPQTVIPGFCPVNCGHKFTLFVIVLGVLKFITAAGRASVVFITARSVDEKDKAIALALGFTLLSVFANIPAPALFGSIFDRSCLWWGKTCSGTGNCWLYDSHTLRYSVTYSAAAVIAVGVLLDIGVWHSAKNLEIFDNEVEETKNEIAEEALADVPLLGLDENGKTR